MMPPASDLSESAEYARKEHARNMKWARAMAAQFEGCSIEAVLLAFRDRAFVSWKEVAFDARMAQLDQDDWAARQAHDAVRAKAHAALDRYQAAVETKDASKERWAKGTIAAWKAYKKLSDMENKAYRRVERAWQKREELWESVRENSATPPRASAASATVGQGETSSQADSNGQKEQIND